MVPAKKDNNAVLPSFSDGPVLEIDRDTPVWIPKEDVTSEELNELEKYLDTARRERGIEKEEALQTLYASNFNLDQALQNIMRRRYQNNAWTDIDAMIFLTGYQQHQKNFHKIHELLPNKTIGEIIDFYYRNRNTPFLNLPARII